MNLKCFDYPIFFAASSFMCLNNTPAFWVATLQAPLRQAFRRRVFGVPHNGNAYSLAGADGLSSWACRKARVLLSCSLSVSASTSSNTMYHENDPPPEYFRSMSKFCRKCGSPMEVSLSDASWRHICTGCGYIDYFNPKMVRHAVI